MPSTRNLVPRNRLGAQDRRTASTDGPTPCIHTAKKTRGEQGQIPIQKTSQTGPLKSDIQEEDSFDPRSILPDTKPKKTLAKLREASAANRPVTLQPTTFNCIDGVSRTFHPLPPRPSSALNTHRPSASQPSARVPSRIDATQDAPRVSFTAFGIEAYPTQALFEDICYDFVSSRRWCPKGTRCVRIHPRDKSKYLAHVIEQSIKVSRLNLRDYSDSEEDERDVPIKSLGQEQSTQRVTSPGAASSTIVQSHSPLGFHDPIKVKLPPPSSSMPRQYTTPSSHSRSSVAVIPPRHRVTQSLPLSSLSSMESKDDVHNWDTVTGLNNPPRSPRASSDCDSSTDDSPELNFPCDPRDWEIHTEESAWSDSNATVDEPPSRPPLKRTGTNFDSSVTVVVKNAIPVPSDPRDWEIHTKESDWDAINEKSVLDQTPAPPASPPVIKKHYRPRNRHRCERWERNRCDLGFDCKYVHDDLDYDSDEPEPDIPKRIPESFMTILHSHIRLRFGSGFDVEDITTGFESPFVFLRGLPHDISDVKLNRLLGRFGKVLGIKRLSSSSAQYPPSFKVEFAKASDAYSAFTSLHGKFELSHKLDLRLSEEGMVNQTKITDTVVRVDWEVPHLSVFMGFDSKELADQAIEKASWTPYGDFAVTGAIHIGLPALGKVTVKFDGMPVDVNPKKLEELYGKHDGWMRTAANYMEPTVEDSISGLKKYLKQFGPTLKDVDIRSPPYKEGKMRAWAYFATPKDAQAAAERIHGRKPPFSGHTRVMARHLHTIEFNLSLTKYRKSANDVDDLAQQIWRQGPGYALAIVDKMSHYVLRLTGENLKVLGQLKSELEKRLNGEQLLEHGKPAWDEFFGRYSGTYFLEDLEREFSGITIQRNVARRTIRIFGSARDRAAVRTRLLEKLTQLRKRGYFVIQLDGRLTNAFINGGYTTLVEKLGADNVVLDLWNRTLRVLGDREAQLLAEDAVSVVRMHHKMNYGNKPRPNECPVCFEEVTVPVKLPCGHSWCRACLKRYLQASVDHKLFPLKCLGREAKCTERVPLYIARDLLSPGEFDAVVQSAFDAHIQTHPSQFHFCPTPDCLQVYRPAPAGTFIQCPSCLVRICPSCHTDAHDGLTCAESGAGDDLFQEWAAQHNVKQCPGCKMAIEKDAGCNHMTCVVCKTHLCWVCMKTFKSVDDVYPHMRHAHGGIGL